MPKKPVKETIHAKRVKINIYTTDFENEFISPTDIARYKSDEPNDVIRNWLRNRDTIEFWDYGKDFIILSLNPLNSTGLENRLD